MNYTSEKTEKHTISFTKEEVWNLLLEKAKDHIDSKGYDFEKEIVQFKDLNSTAKEAFISGVTVTLINPIRIVLRTDENERKADN